jgi:hypothetical protein
MNRTIRYAPTVVLFVSALSCNKSEQPAEKQAATASATPAAPAPPQAPWYVGRWSGKYESRRYEMKMPRAEGAVREWADDPGKAGAGSGTLAIEVNDGGTAAGTATGPLGELIATGAVENDALTLQLRPAKTGSPTAEVFNGFIVAKREGAALKGSLRASSGDGVLVRDGTVELTSAAGSATP